MNKNIFTYIAIGIGKILLFIVFSIALVGWVYAITWPTTPTGEPVLGGMIPYLQKALVNTDYSTTDGKVKMALDADSVGSGSLVSVDGKIGVNTSTPTANLDVDGTMKMSSLQVTGDAASGAILVSDSAGVATWQPNNYRLGVRSLMDGGGTYGQLCFTMNDATAKCVWYSGNGEIGIGKTGNFYLPARLPLDGVKKIISNNHSTYAVMEDGRVMAWGYNSFGELGVGDTTSRLIPTEVVGIDNAVDVVTGGAYYTDGVSFSGWFVHTCALLDDGMAKCWGYNNYGQLGVGDTTNRWVPTEVLGLTNIKKLVMQTGQHPSSTCALLESGTIKCWGWNGHGALGVGDTPTDLANRSVPTTVKNITNAVDIDLEWSYTHGAHACAVLDDGAVKCWGYNGQFQLWDGSNTARNTPVVVSWLSNVAKIVIAKGSGYVTYAILNDGTVKAWGYNGQWQVGNGSISNTPIPVTIPDLNNVVSITSAGWGVSSTCALISDGTVKCWWDNAQWQLGNGITVDQSSPITVPLIDNAVDVRMYETMYSSHPFACALLSDGRVKCWGYGGYGQLGQGDTNTFKVPTVVKNLNKD